MKVLYNWLREFVALTAPPKDLAYALSMAGIAIEAIEETPAGVMLDAELTANRSDCLGHYGIAREIAALFRLPLKSVQPHLQESATPASGASRVEIECPDLCGRYTARIIRGVKVQPSPDWLRQRLEALGQASINNVVDATNYVMLELGHPMHAFDMERLAEGRIVVRRARPGEKLRTLDGIERALTPGMCMIADAKRSVAIGGVMGGAESEISFSSKNVLLESAWFDPISTRRTSKALGLRSEASMRFERGMDIEMAELASRRCAELIRQLTGGELLAGVLDAFPKPFVPRPLELTRRELLRIMGADVPDAEIEAILGALGFAPRRSDALRGSNGSLMAAWECRQPPWRLDVAREIDLIEEVARHYGFEKFPAALPGTGQAAARLPHAAAEDRLRERLRARGYSEIVTIPILAPEDDAVFCSQGTTPVKIGNPLSEDASILRTSGLAGMARALEWNINRGQHNLKFFEIGRRYQLRDKMPVETRILTLGATGLAQEKSIHAAARSFAFGDLKGDLESLGELIGGFEWSPSSAAAAPAWLHPARSAALSLFEEEGGQEFSAARSAHKREGAFAPEIIGFAGQLHRHAAEHFKLRQEAFIAELLLDPLYAACGRAVSARHFTPIPRFPAVERDFSLILSDSVAFAQVQSVIRALGIAELASLEAADIFRGGQIPKGKYSLLLRVLFQSRETTFTDAQLTDFSARIVRALEERLSATLRAS